MVASAPALSRSSLSGGFAHAALPLRARASCTAVEFLVLADDRSEPDDFHSPASRWTRVFACFHHSPRAFAAGSLLKKHRENNSVDDEHIAKRQFYFLRFLRLFAAILRFAAKKHKNHKNASLFAFRTPIQAAL